MGPGRDDQAVRAATYGRPSGTWLADRGWTRRFTNNVVTEYTPDRGAAADLRGGVVLRNGAARRRPSQLHRLRRYIAALRMSGFDVVPYRVALHRKVAFPFVALVMTLIAVPFAVTTGRPGHCSGRPRAPAGDLVLGALGHLQRDRGSRILSPPLAASAPNVLFISTAGFLLLTVRT